MPTWDDGISDEALEMLKKAAQIAEVHHAFTRGKITEWEAANGGQWDASHLSMRDMAMTFALVLVTEGRFSDAQNLLEEAGVDFKQTSSKLS